MADLILPGWHSAFNSERQNGSFTLETSDSQDRMGNNFPRVAKITDFGLELSEDRGRMTEE